MQGNWPGKGWRQGCALLALLLLAGCRTPVAGEAGRDALAAWEQAPRRTYDNPRLHVAAITVESFRWHSRLTSWVNSRELLMAAARQWLSLPAARCHLAVEPNRAALERFFTTDLPAALTADDLLVLYLGTHQLADGRLLLGGNDDLGSAEFVAWVSALPPRRIVLLADVCHAAELERAGRFDDHVVRLYAALGDELAPDIPLDGPLRAVRDFFAATDAVVRQELDLHHRQYSLFGYLAVHALRLHLQAGDDELRVDALAATMETELARLAPQVRRIALPRLAIVNPQPWLLAADRPTPPPSSPPRTPPAAAPITDLPGLLAQPPPQLDVGLGNLLIGQRYQPNAELVGPLAQLDAMAAELRRRLGEERRVERIAAVFADYLYDDLGLQAVAQPYPTDFLLGELLTTKRGRCSALVSLYLALGHRLGLPWRSVCIPEHIFVRWERQANDGWIWPANVDHVNLETTREGRLLPDSAYGQADWAAESPAWRFYLRPLDHRQTVGTLLAPLASALLARGELATAELAARESLAINPEDAEAWNTLGSIHRRQEARAKAAEAYRQALAINPHFAEAWNNLGTVVADATERIDCYLRATKLKPTLGEAWRNLAIAYEADGRYQLAWACIQRAREQGQPLPPEFVERVRRHLKP